MSDEQQITHDGWTEPALPIAVPEAEGLGGPDTGDLVGPDATDAVPRPIDDPVHPSHVEPYEGATPVQDLPPQPAGAALTAAAALADVDPHVTHQCPSSVPCPPFVETVLRIEPPAGQG